MKIDVFEQTIKEQYDDLFEEALGNHDPKNDDEDEEFNNKFHSLIDPLLAAAIEVDAEITALKKGAHVESFEEAVAPKISKFLDAYRKVLSFINQ